MATTTHLDIDQGSDWVTEITLENDDSTPMNLNGYLVFSQFRKSYGSSVAYNFTASVTNAAQGKIQLVLPGIASSSIRAGRYLYDVEIFNIHGGKTRVVEGIVTINPEITKMP